MSAYYLGVDIGGTKCAVLLGKYENGRLSIEDKLRFPTEAQKGYEYTSEKLFSEIDSLLKKHSDKTIDAMGISCGGPLNSKTGRILSPPNLYGWDDIPIVKLMEEKFGITAYLENDANACALAEWKFGAARGMQNVIFLTFGTGMGAGLILDGKLYSGTTGMAGEVGHLRLAEQGPVGFGKSGSFEGFCSGGGIAQIARTVALQKLQMGQHPGFCGSISELDSLSAKSVAEAALAGDEDAKEVYEICAEYLGRGLSLLIDILNPQMIVLGSIYERSESLLREGALRVIRREAIQSSAQTCEIVPAKLGDSIGDYAALSIAISRSS